MNVVIYLVAPSSPSSSSIHWKTLSNDDLLSSYRNSCAAPLPSRDASGGSLFLFVRKLATQSSDLYYSIPRFADLDYLDC